MDQISLINLLEIKKIKEDVFDLQAKSGFLKRAVPSVSTTLPINSVYTKLLLGTQSDSVWSTASEFIVPSDGDYEITANVLITGLTAETVQSIYMKFNLNGVDNNGVYKHTKRATEQLVGTFGGSFKKNDKIYINLATSSTTGTITVSNTWTNIQVKKVG